MLKCDELTLSKMKINDFFEDSHEILDNHYETYLTDFDGISIPVLSKNSRYFLSDYEYRVDSFIDISTLKNAEEMLFHSNQILEEKIFEKTKELQDNYDKLNKEIESRRLAEMQANKEKEVGEMKSKFLSTVSHEFRSPLTIIRSGAEILYHHFDKLDKAKAQTFAKFLEMI